MENSMKTKLKAFGFASSQPADFTRSNKIPNNGKQHHIHQRSGGDAPQRRARTLRRRHISHAAKHPQHDVMGFPAHGAARQLVSKLMNQHDQEQRETFRHAPRQGRITPRLLDEIGDRQKPRPVQIDGDAEKLEEPDGAFSRWHVRLIYPIPARLKQGFWRTAGGIGFDAA